MSPCRGLPPEDVGLARPRHRAQGGPLSGTSEVRPLHHLALGRIKRVGTETRELAGTLATVMSGTAPGATIGRARDPRGDEDEACPRAPTLERHAHDTSPT